MTGTKLLCGLIEMFQNYVVVMTAQLSGKKNTDLYTLKWQILCYVKIYVKYI